MTTFFMSTWWGDCKNMLPDWLIWLCYLASSSKSHRENSISCIFLESPHQVDMKNVVKCYKHFFCYFNALKTRFDILYTASCMRYIVLCHKSTLFKYWVHWIEIRLGNFQVFWGIARSWLYNWCFYLRSYGCQNVRWSNLLRKFMSVNPCQLCIPKYVHM